jgi:hypothetical protein
MKSQNLTGEKLLKTVVNQILAHPETWKQDSWHSLCGTKHCVAGWCQLLSGKGQDSNTAKEDAQAALGLTDSEAAHLFRPGCTISEIHHFAANFGVAGYNRAGYDRAGYDRAGYDRDGYHRDGYHRDGYDRAGYNRDGYHRDGEKLKPFDI